MGKICEARMARGALWPYSAMVVAVVAMTLCSVGNAEDSDLSEYGTPSGGWTFVPKPKSKAAVQKKAVTQLAKAKGRWVRVGPGQTKGQVAKKLALLDAKLKAGAKAARKAAENKGKVGRSVERSKKRVAKARSMKKVVNAGLKKLKRTAASAKKESKQTNDMKEMTTYMKMAAAAKDKIKKLKKTKKKMKKTIKRAKAA